MAARVHVLDNIFQGVSPQDLGRLGKYPLSGPLEGPWLGVQGFCKFWSRRRRGYVFLTSFFGGVSCKGLGRCPAEGGRGEVNLPLESSNTPTQGSTDFQIHGLYQNGWFLTISRFVGYVRMVGSAVFQDSEVLVGVDFSIFPASQVFEMFRFK